MLYLNYENALRALDSKDVFVVRLTGLLQRSMLSDANRRLHPAQPFDMHYFFDSVISVVAGLVGHDVDIPLVSHGKLCACNDPPLESNGWKHFEFVKSGLANDYIKYIKAASFAEGTPFDLEFACKIACTALDADSLSWAKAGIGLVREDDSNNFDQWLDGFNTQDS